MYPKLYGRFVTILFSTWKSVSLFSCWSFSSSRCPSELQMLPLPCWSLSWFQPLCFHLLSLWLPGMWTLLRLLCLVLRVWLGLLFDSCFAVFWFCLCWHEVQLSLRFWPVSQFYFVCLCGCVQAEICHLQSLGILVNLWMSIWSRFWHQRLSQKKLLAIRAYNFEKL